jgi:hypothetical protein
MSLSCLRTATRKSRCQPDLHDDAIRRRDRQGRSRHAPYKGLGDSTNNKEATRGERR